MAIFGSAHLIPLICVQVSCFTNSSMLCYALFCFCLLLSNTAVDKHLVLSILSFDNNLLKQFPSYWYIDISVNKGIIQLNSVQNSNIFIQENAFENVWPCFSGIAMFTQAWHSADEKQLPRPFWGYKDKTVLRLAHLYNENPHTREDGLYIETGPWFCTKPFPKPLMIYFHGIDVLTHLPSILLRNFILSWLNSGCVLFSRSTSLSILLYLTHWGWDRMSAMLQMALSDAFF